MSNSQIVLWPRSANQSSMT
uniref:Uncharacterized protein n=1 Tax=Arundo donax TaxID=35708 RepID=A0A0A9A586_ARUDO